MRTWVLFLELDRPVSSEDTSLSSEIIFTVLRSIWSPVTCPLHLPAEDRLTPVIPTLQSGTAAKSPQNKLLGKWLMTF
jgi:hypothetical protein